MKTPTYDNFQVAPNTLPQTRFGAQEMGDPGAAITQQAKLSMALGQHYGEQALQQMMAANQSVADQKWVEVENYRLQLQQEYEQERGLNALNREGGLSLADEYNNKLNQFIADQAESLNNRAQVEMFAHRVGPTQADFSDGVTKHMMAEGRKFQEETLKGRMDVTVSGAVVAPTEQAFATSITRLEQNIGDTAAYYGWAPEKAQMELRAKVGEVVSQRANRLMDLGDYQQAQSMVAQYGQMMDGKTALDLATRVNKFQMDEEDTQLGRALAEAYQKGGMVDLGGDGGGGQSTVSTSEDINRAVAKIIRNESGGDSNATNKSSTAKGLGQFIDSTWLTMVKRYRPDIAAGKSNAQIIALKTNAPLAREMTTRYVEENARALRSAGMPVTDGNLYLAHFLGAGGAVKLLSAQDKSQPVVNLVGQKVVDVNRFIQGKSVQWVIDWAARKMGQQGGRTQQQMVRIPGGDWAAIERQIDRLPPGRRENVRRAARDRRAMIEQGENDLIQKTNRNALDAIASGATVQDLPAEVKTILGPSRLQALDDYRDKLVRGEQNKMEEAAKPIYYDFLYHPEKLTGMSEEQIINMAPTIGMDKANNLLERKRRQERDGDQSVPKVEAEVLNWATRQLNIKTGSNASAEDVQKRGWLIDNIMQANRDFYSTHKRYMTQGEVREFVTKTLMDNYVSEYMLRGVFWDSLEQERVPALIASPQQRGRMRYEQGSK
nr:MAG TPA: lytic transglycosylase, bacteriophage, phiKZ, endolysin, peptidoglycan.5A [Caudoviricetes sp.]